eukprot:2643591-Rhodomonas_salina.1
MRSAQQDRPAATPGSVSARSYAAAHPGTLSQRIMTTPPHTHALQTVPFCPSVILRNSAIALCTHYRMSETDLESTAVPDPQLL